MSAGFERAREVLAQAGVFVPGERVWVAAITDPNTASGEVLGVFSSQEAATVRVADFVLQSVAYGDALPPWHDSDRPEPRTGSQLQALVEEFGGIDGLLAHYREFGYFDIEVESIPVSAPVSGELTVAAAVGNG